MNAMFDGPESLRLNLERYAISPVVSCSIYIPDSVRKDRRVLCRSQMCSPSPKSFASWENWLLTNVTWSHRKKRVGEWRQEGAVRIPVIQLENIYLKVSMLTSVSRSPQIKRLYVIYRTSYHHSQDVRSAFLSEGETHPGASAVACLSERTSYYLQTR